MENKTINIGEALNFGWVTFKKNIGLLVGILILIVVSSIIAGALDLITFGIASIVVTTIITMGTISILLKLVDGQPTHLSDLYKTYHPFLNFIVASIIASIIIVFGYVLFIIPGIYLTLMLYFFSYLIVDQNLGPVHALKASAKLTKGVKWSLFGAILIFAIINIFGLLMLGIGLLVTYPVTMIATTYIYRRLQEQTNLSNLAPETKSSVNTDMGVEPKNLVRERAVSSPTETSPPSE